MSTDYMGACKQTYPGKVSELLIHAAAWPDNDLCPRGAESL